MIPALENLSHWLANLISSPSTTRSCEKRASRRASAARARHSSGLIWDLVIFPSSTTDTNRSKTREEGLCSDKQRAPENPHSLVLREWPLNLTSSYGFRRKLKLCDVIPVVEQA